MTPAEARELLLLYRPDRPEEADAATLEALNLSKANPELGRWFEEHCAMQQAIRAKLRQTAVPAELRDRILSGRKVVPMRTRLPWQWIAAAACLVLVFGWALWLKPPPSDRFEDFSKRMVRTALREYHMDILTNDLASIRKFHSKEGSPADYQIKKELAKLPITGGGLLKWRGNPVSMVCFNRGDGQMLFLFVLNQTAVPNPPPVQAEKRQVSKLQTASWTEGNRVYLLAGPPDTRLLQNLL